MNTALNYFLDQLPEDIRLTIPYGLVNSALKKEKSHICTAFSAGVINGMSSSNRISGNLYFYNTFENNDEQLIRQAEEKYPKGTMVEALFLDGAFCSNGKFETCLGNVWTNNDIGKPVRVYRCDMMKWADLKKT